MNADKSDVAEFWSEAACGERLYLGGRGKQHFQAHSEIRYRLEPYISSFADFDGAAGKKVLEIGVGLGADHQRFAEAGAELHGIDLTERAIDLVAQRFRHFGLHSELSVGDAEALPYSDNIFDIVYSWGVIHHSPDTPTAAREILRVLKPGGRFAVMIYHRYSLVGYMLWLRYALLRGRPFTSLAAVYAEHLESPGTKAYTQEEARHLFAGASNLKTRTVLTHADLLESDAGQRHRGPLLAAAKRIWPRQAIRRLLPGHGLFLLIEGRKPG